MSINLLQVSAPSLGYVLLGGFVAIFCMFSLFVKEKLFINEVVLGTVFGIIMGPHGANVFNPRAWGSDNARVTLEVTRVVLGFGLFAIGVELPKAYMAKHVKGLLVMVVPTMAFGWIAIAAIIHGLFPNLSFISSLTISACLTPTDPIICAVIVGGKYALDHVPKNIRHILAAEAAANDGLAYPFLSISIYLTVESSLRVAFGKWFLVGWLYQVILGTVLGGLLGYGSRKLIQFLNDKGYNDQESYVAQFLALSILSIGVASTIGSDDLLAAFAAGCAISWDGDFKEKTKGQVFPAVMDFALNCGCFVYIGAWLPFGSYNSPELGIAVWRLISLLLCILVLRRIPALLLLFPWVPEIDSWKGALFSGHFGPMGVSAIFVSTLALSRLPPPHNPPRNQQELLAATLQTLVSFIVLGSIIVHGLSVSLFSFGRNIHTRALSMARTWTSSRQGCQLQGRRPSSPVSVGSKSDVKNDVAMIEFALDDPEIGLTIRDNNVTTPGQR